MQAVASSIQMHSLDYNFRPKTIPLANLIRLKGDFLFLCAADKLKQNKTRKKRQAQKENILSLWKLAAKFDGKNQHSCGQFCFQINSVCCQRSVNLLLNMFSFIGLGWWIIFAFLISLCICARLWLMSFNRWFSTTSATKLKWVFLLM